MPKKPKCSKYGSLVWEGTDKDSIVVHLTSKHWRNTILRRHPDMALEFSRVLDTIQDFDDKKTYSSSKSRYFKRFTGNPPIEVVTCGCDLGKRKTHVIHAMLVIGTVIAMKQLMKE